MGLWTSVNSEQSDSVAVEARSLLPTEAVDNRGDSKVEKNYKKKKLLVKKLAKKKKENKKRESDFFTS